MTRTMRSHELHVPAWLSTSELQPHIDRFISYIRECGYSQSTVRVYRNAIAHFAHWMTANEMPFRRLNEELIERFLSQHLPACHCGSLRQRWPHTMRAALKVLVRFLRRERLLGAARPIDPPSITQELKSFGHYQKHVCGLTQATREVSRHRVRAFLIDCFGGGAIRMATLREKDVTGFLTRYTVNCTPRSRSVICRS